MTGAVTAERAPMRREIAIKIPFACAHLANIRQNQRISRHP
jgi:hypothetical protein